MVKRSLRTAVLALPLLAAGCYSTPPNAEEILNLGFRTPEMTFRTFQAGVRGELPRLEYRCLSGGFRSRNHLSQILYREFRDSELAPKLWFRVGVPDAEILESIALSVGRHRIRAGAYGHEFVLEFVREDFFAIYAGEELLADEPITNSSFPDWLEIYRPEGLDGWYLAAGAELPSELAEQSANELLRELTEFRIGRDWKIDSIGGAAPPIDP